MHGTPCTAPSHRLSSTARTEGSGGTREERVALAVQLREELRDARLQLHLVVRPRARRQRLQQVEAARGEHRVVAGVRHQLHCCRCFVAEIPPRALVTLAFCRSAPAQPPTTVTTAAHTPQHCQCHSWRTAEWYPHAFMPEPRPWPAVSRRRSLLMLCSMRKGALLQIFQMSAASRP